MWGFSSNVKYCLVTLTLQENRQVLYAVFYLALTFSYSRSSPYKDGQCLLPDIFSCAKLCGAPLQIYGNSSNHFFKLLFKKSNWYFYTVQMGLDGGYLFARNCGCVKSILIFFLTAGY